MYYDDPTPATPFLRSDCTGQCQQTNSGLRDVKHVRHSHAHSHSHSHNISTTQLFRTTDESKAIDYRESTPVRMTTRSSSMTPSTSKINSAVTQEEYQNHNNSIRELEHQRSNSRISTVSNISHASHISTQRRKALAKVLDLDDPKRTDYTYSHSQTYASKRSPQFENPRMCRRSLNHRTSTSTIRSLINGTPIISNWWRRLTSYFWWSKREDVSEISRRSSDSGITTTNAFDFDTDDEKLEHHMTNNANKNNIVVAEQVDGENNSSFATLSRTVMENACWISWMVMTTLITTIKYPAYKTISLKNSIVCWMRREDKDDVYYEEKNNVNGDLTTISEESVVDFGNNQQSFALHKSARCCGLPIPLWLLLLLLLFCVPLLFGHGKQKIIIQSYILPPAMLVMNYTKEAYFTGREMTKEWMKPNAVQFNTLPPESMNPQYLQYVKNLQAAVDKLEAKLSLISVDCCKQPDLTAFITGEQASKVVDTNSIVVGLNEEQRKMRQQIQDIQLTINSFTEGQNGIDNKLREGLLSLQAKLENGKQENISPEFILKFDKVNSRLNELSEIVVGLKTLEEKMVQLQQSQNDNEQNAQKSVTKSYGDLQAIIINTEKKLRSELNVQMQEIMSKYESHSAEIKQINVYIQNLETADFLGDKPKIELDVSSKGIEEMIRLAIAKYDQDKTGMADHAFEPAGASVISTRCSETYDAKTRVESIWGIPILSGGITPRTVIQPGLQVGECWAFKGSMGSLVIKLTGLIHISSVSYEHISKAIAPDGHIQSAPHVFQLWGLMNETDEQGVHLGEFTYDDNTTPLQNFPIQNTKAGPFPMVELKVLRNYGHPVYTCLYRFRVHGKRIAPAYGFEE